MGVSGESIQELAGTVAPPDSSIVPPDSSNDPTRPFASPRAFTKFKLTVNLGLLQAKETLSSRAKTKRD